MSRIGDKNIHPAYPPALAILLILFITKRLQSVRKCFASVFVCAYSCLSKKGMSNRMVASEREDAAKSANLCVQVHLIKLWAVGFDVTASVCKSLISPRKIDFFFGKDLR